MQCEYLHSFASIQSYVLITNYCMLQLVYPMVFITCIVHNQLQVTKFSSKASWFASSMFDFAGKPQNGIS